MLAAQFAMVGGVVTVLLSWASMLWADFPAVPPGMAPVSLRFISSGKGE